MGGVGKTELARKYFWENKNKYDYYGWVDYNSNIKESFVDKINTEEIKTTKNDSFDDRYRKTERYLSNLNENSLLIIDNISDIDDESLSIINSLPFKVLTTSRNVIDDFEIHTLGFLSDDEAKELFYIYYKGEKDDESLSEIVRLSGNHTLTIELLAKTAQNTYKPIKEFLDTLNEQGFTLENIKEKVKSNKDNETTNDIFFEHILKLFKLSGVNEKELYILVNLSILPAEYIDIKDIKEWLKLESANDINSLIEKGWLKESEFKVFMHNMIQEVVRDREKPCFEDCGVLIESLNNKLSTTYYETRLNKQQYTQYSESIIKYINKENELIVALLNNLSLVYKELGILSKALKLIERTLYIEKRIYGDNSLELEGTYNNLSLIHKDMGNLEDALKYIKYSIRINELSNNKLSLAINYNNLSMIYYDLGRYSKSLEYQKLSLTLREDDPFCEDIVLSENYSNISMIYRVSNKLEEALKYEEKSIKIREHELKPNHPMLAKSYNNISLIYEEMNNLDLALKYQKKSIAIREEIYDKNHPSLAVAYNNIAMIHDKKGNFNKGIEYLLKAISITKNNLGENHYQLAGNYNSISLIYISKEKFEDAKEYMLKAIEIMESNFPKGHLHLAFSYYTISSIFSRLKDKVLGKNYLLEAIDMMKTVKQTEHIAHSQMLDALKYFDE
jgi:tetratricopeptide (TPR) repeat protein